MQRDRLFTHKIKSEKTPLQELHNEREVSVCMFRERALITRQEALLRTLWHCFKGPREKRGMKAGWLLV